MALRRVLALNSLIDGVSQSMILCTIDDERDGGVFIKAEPFERETHSTIVARYIEIIGSRIIKLKY